MATIFWSWQSDRPHRETRAVIRDALEAAIASLSSSVEEADRPGEESITLDSDTQGIGGSPDIVATIFEKIDVATAFVADVTPIAVSIPQEGKRPKHIANPNVLIELGYAKNALKPERIVQVWNTAFTGCTPEDLPFDMRGRRGPVSFHLPEGASTEQLRTVRAKLTTDLKTALEMVLRGIPKPAPAALRWHPHREDDPSVWFEPGHSFLINEPDHGAGSKSTPEAPTSFVRLLPASWHGSDSSDLHDSLLWSGGGFSWGDTAEGVLTYPGSVIVSENEVVHTLTLRFAETGEVWAIRRSITGEWQGHLRLDASGVTEGWARYLRYAVPSLLGRGGAAPIHVKLGVCGIKGLFWPTNPSWGGKPPVALADQVTHEFTIADGDVESLVLPLTQAWTLLRRRFSQPPATEDEVRGYLARWK